VHARAASVTGSGGAVPVVAAATPAASPPALSAPALVQRTPAPAPSAAAPVAAAVELPTRTAAGGASGAEGEVGAKVEVEDVAERVYEILARRLASERKLRGW
jgi:hypothetical protein